MRTIRPWPSVAGTAFALAIAGSALASGAGLVVAGMTWSLSRDGCHVTSRGAQLYAAECAGCHGARLEGQTMRAQADRPVPLPAPSLGAAGHAWRHSDAELAAIVASGTAAAVSMSNVPTMPAFEERLGRDDVHAILAYIKSRWPASIRAYQQSLNPGQDEPLTASLDDPAWTFPGQCSVPFAKAVGL